MSNPQQPQEEWLYEIAPKNNLFSFNLKEVWQLEKESICLL